MDLERTRHKPPAGLVAQSFHVGQFTWDTVADSWWWSDAMYRLYGYEPHAVQPSMQRFLQHKDPRDRARIDAVFARCLSGGGPFSCYHHVIDAQQRKKTVVVVGCGYRDAEDTQTVSMQGFMVDVTARGRQDTNAALQAALETRAGIEQVKGALMLVHGLDAEAAFDLLRGHSQVYNQKLTAIVAAMLAAFRGRDSSAGVTRAEVDQMLWNAANQGDEG